MSRLGRDDVERFELLVERLKQASRTLEGKSGVSQFDRSELQPGYEQLQHHLDRALYWAEEMNWIIERELTPQIVLDERAAAS